MSEASLEVNTRYRNDLEEEKTRLLRDMDRLKRKVKEGSSDTLWQHRLSIFIFDELRSLVFVCSWRRVKTSTWRLRNVLTV